MSEPRAPEPLAVDVRATVAAMQSTFDRIRRGEWRVIVMGPRTAAERTEATQFTTHLLQLADVVEVRR